MLPQQTDFTRLVRQVRDHDPAAFTELMRCYEADVCRMVESHLRNTRLGRLVDAVAAGVVAGTRFLLSDESHAHPDYKRRCVEAEGTLLTELFGLSWPNAPHRVIPNAATRRWLSAGERGPEWIRVANRVSRPLALRLPDAIQRRALASQRASQPFLGPQPPTDDGPDNLLDSGPLYAGQTVARLTNVAPAAQLVRELVP